MAMAAAGELATTIATGGCVFEARIGKAMEKLKEAIKNDLFAYELLKKKLQTIGSSVRRSNAIKFIVFRGLVESNRQAVTNITVDVTEAVGIDQMSGLLVKRLKSLNDSCDDDPKSKEILNLFIETCRKESSSESIKVEQATPSFLLPALAIIAWTGDDLAREARTAELAKIGLCTYILNSDLKNILRKIANQLMKYDLIIKSVGNDDVAKF
jgi:hypothetical protein